ncbi:hypothetical protein ADIARSV_3853 [Arcticibacter svalbardensis MN12-7]|uniref:DUF4397 domain-containing protein n=1 Tax=Arcticibacter svalbardensis MN12-7 TaxID=1150600 RepID=R9GMR5_9SPHI|nr:DUF4397 domain-containing protein [Arcticibacter svalbardensis]EOR93001.1 hypothetical protein ADIARSV_3853 [Arcticibacter svalbardensis MN12-7]
MKISNISLSKLFLFAAAGLTLSLSSCSKDDDFEAGGSVNIKVVNAAESSPAQDVFINDTKINSSAVAYSQSTGYFTTPNSGNDRRVEFRTTGTTNVFESEDTDLRQNGNYTFFLTGTGSSADIQVAEDNLSAPSSGKAKVRFLHVSGAVAEDIDIYNGTVKIVGDLERGDEVTGFQEVNAGVTGFGILPLGNTNITAVTNISFAALEAGKIYTILIYGSTTASANVIAHN